MVNISYCKTLISFFLMHSMVLSLRAEPLSYTMYPTPTFTKIEKVCNEICLDLQAIHFNNELHTQWVETSDYLINQFLLLHSSLQLLINNPQELRSYLIEDLTYLKNIFETVECNFVTLYQNCSEDMKIGILQKILFDCKNHFSTLFSYSREILL